jgi:hypothetical protein
VDGRVSEGVGERVSGGGGMSGGGETANLYHMSSVISERRTILYENVPNDNAR